MSGPGTNACRSLLLAPHNDDESLFAAFTCLRYRPRVVVVFRSFKQEASGVRYPQREAETTDAAAILGVEYEQWTFPDNLETDPEALVACLRGEPAPDRVFVPAVEERGHEQHNLVGEAAREVFGDRVTSYLTYTDGRARSTSGREVEYEPDWIGLKLRALACYRSQHGLWSCAHHFLAPQLEYYA